MSSKETKNNPHERLKEIIAKFTLNHSYWGYLFSHLKRVPAENFGSIMAVAPTEDGVLLLLYEPNLVAGTDDKNLEDVIIHEGMHILNKHIPRLMRIYAAEVNKKKFERKREAWNIAADCVVNTQAKIKDSLVINGETWPLCFPEKYGLPENRITEEYFTELLKRQEEGKGKGEAKGHEKWCDGLDSSEDPSSLARKIDQQTQDIIRESVRNFQKSRGKLPAGLERLIQEALEPPKAPYYQIIQRLVKGSRMTKIKRSPTRINRKRTYTFLIDDVLLPEISPFPGKTKDVTFNICALIDTSASMSVDNVKEGLSGIKNIIEKDRFCKTTVLEVDVGVEKEYSPKKISDIQFNVKGGGGTTLLPGLERARELGCDVCLAFTDGFCENLNNVPRRLLPKRIIWILTPEGNADAINRTGFIVRI